MLHFLFSKSQTISDVDFSINNKQIYISYVLSGIPKYPIYSYDFCIKVSRKNNPEIITPITISGDTKEVKTNGNKLIIWDVFSDVEYLEGDFKIEVYVCNKNSITIEKPYTPIKIKQPKGNHKSFLGPILLVSLGAGSKFYSESNYKSYLSATTQSEMDSYYKKANTFNKAFVVSAGTGIVWGLIKMISNKKPSYSKLKFNGSSIAYTINTRR